MTAKENQYLQLMEENRQTVFRIAAVYTDTAEDRRDLMQEIAYQVWKSFDTFSSKSSRSTWFYRVALNTSMQFLKKAKRRSSGTLYPGMDLDAYHAADHRHSAEEEVRKLMLAIQQLKEIEKAIILLYLEEKSHSEIAAITKLSVSNVGTRIQRIKKRLEHILNDMQDEF